MVTVKKIPMRKCTGCGESKPKKDLVRVLKTAEDGIVIDLTGRKNGRGAYICHNPKCLARAIKTRAIERSLGESVSTEVYEELKKELGE